MSPHINEAALKQRLENKQLVENQDHMTAQYKDDLIRILTVSADTELVSAPAYYYAARNAPFRPHRGFPKGSARELIC